MLKSLQTKTSMATEKVSKKTLYRKILSLWKDGEFFFNEDKYYDDVFRGSMDRFVEIAFRLQDYPRVLDLGAGHGLLTLFLKTLGHECYAVDINPLPTMLKEKEILFERCNIEVDPLPFDDASFDAAVCCQCLEHFTHSHLFTIKEIHRVLKAPGILEVDVPNAVCFRNRSRMLRGKHITWDYKDHYLFAEPISYRGMSFFPDRHNREFTLEEVKLLLKEGGFQNIDAWHLKSRRYRTGMSKVLTLGSMLRDAIPSFRKSIIAFGYKGFI